MIDNEIALLGAVLIAPKLYWPASEIVTETDFYSSVHAMLWRVITRMAMRGDAVDPITLWAEMTDAEKEHGEQLGGRNYVHSLITGVPSSANWRTYAEQLHEEALDRRLRRDVTSALNLAGGSELLSQLEEIAYHSERSNHKAGNIQSAAEALHQELQEEKPKNVLSFPWQDVQMQTRGMWPGTLTVLAGETSHGKTSAALEIVDNLVKQGKKVLYVSLEMTAREIAIRLAQRYGLDSAAVYKQREVTSQDFSRLHDFIGTADWRNLVVVPATTVEQMVSWVRRTKPDLMVLDHLHLLPVKGDRYTALTQHTAALKGLAIQHGIPVLCLAQLNRDATERTKPPGLHRLRDSGSIEQDADNVIFVWRRRDEHGALCPEGQWVTAKARMGVTGAADMSFDGKSQRFYGTMEGHFSRTESPALPQRVVPLSDPTPKSAVAALSVFNDEVEVAIP